MVKNEIYIIDWQTKYQRPEEYLHSKEFTDFEKAKSFLQKLRANEDVVYIEKDAICVHDEAGRFVRYEEVPREGFTAIQTTPNCINNFGVIDHFLQFEEGTFYKFELLVRNTDGENILFPERCSNTNRNILIKSWYVDTKDYYEKIKHEMVTLSNITGARLYVTLDRKDNVKLCQALIKAYTDDLVAIVNKQKPSIKSISKTFASETSKVENSSKTAKTLMWDVDTKQIEIVNHVHEYIRSKGQEPFTLKTKKGYHVFCYRKFNHADWLDWCVEHEFKYAHFENRVPVKDYRISFATRFKELVSVKENELGLVYHPMKSCK